MRRGITLYLPFQVSNWTYQITNTGGKKIVLYTYVPLSIYFGEFCKYAYTKVDESFFSTQRILLSFKVDPSL